MVLPVFVCIYCKHYLGTANRDPPPTCEAFNPGPIPEEILAMASKHLHPIEGDHGLQFEPKTEFEGLKEEFLEAESDKIEGGMIIID